MHYRAADGAAAKPRKPKSKANNVTQVESNKVKHKGKQQGDTPVQKGNGRIAKKRPKGSDGAAAKPREPKWKANNVTKVESNKVEKHKGKQRSLHSRTPSLKSNTNCFPPPVAHLHSCHSMGPFP
jgi:hypothetical protein